MKLQRTRIRAAILSLCLASAMAGVGCGSDDSDPMVAMGPSPATAADAGTGSATNGGTSTSTTHDAAAQAPASSTTGSTGTTSGTAAKPDAGKPPTTTSDGDESKNPASNTVYMGDPVCGKFGGKLAGTVEGKSVMLELSSIGRGDETYSTRAGSDVEQRIEVHWAPALVPGVPSAVTKGSLTLPSSSGLGPYCLIEGQALLDPTTAKGEPKRYFIKITKMKKQVNLDCTGDDITVDLNMCDRS
jgi:hypothetical protein